MIFNNIFAFDAIGIWCKVYEQTQQQQQRQRKKVIQQNNHDMQYEKKKKQIIDKIQREIETKNFLVSICFSN